jgi:hypothetical protein
MLDTRNKIVTVDQARALAGKTESPRVAFVTHLEVLRAGHVRKLEELAAGNPGTLFLILTDPPFEPNASPLTPLAARAEVAAALRVVDYVVPSPGGAVPALSAIQADLTVQDEEEDRERTRLLVEHVRCRSRI